MFFPAELSNPEFLDEYGELVIHVVNQAGTRSSRKCEISLLTITHRN